MLALQFVYSDQTKHALHSFVLFMFSLVVKNEMQLQ